MRKMLYHYTLFIGTTWYHLRTCIAIPGEMSFIANSTVLCDSLVTQLYSTKFLIGWWALFSGGMITQQEQIEIMNVKEDSVKALCVFTSLPPVTSYLRTNNVNTNTKCSQNTNTDSVKDLCDILSEN